MKEDSQPIAREMRPELEAHSIWSLPPTLILFTILVADRTLRARFEADVPGVLVEFGMKSPKHLVGLSERLCPVMPRIPTDVEAAEPWTTRCQELMAIHASASQTRGM